MVGHANIVPSLKVGWQSMHAAVAVSSVGSLLRIARCGEEQLSVVIDHRRMVAERSPDGCISAPEIYRILKTLPHADKHRK